MSKDDKNIYDLLNEVDFDISDEKEIPMNDIEKKKIKNIIKGKRKKKAPRRNKILISSAAVIAILVFIFSPMGREAIAAIAEKFFFNPGLGVINVKEELYVLKEPIMIDSENKEILIKGIASNKDGLNIQLWINDEKRAGLSKEEILNFEDIIKSVHINTLDGKELELTSISTAGGGSNYFISIWCESNYVITGFGIKVYDSYKNVVLDKVEEGGEFYNIGGNDTDNNLFIGGNKYIFEDKTYITLWSDEGYINKEMFYFGVNKEDVKVTDLDGQYYEVNHSEYGGNSKEFVINEKIEKPLNIDISKIRLEYRLNKPIDIKVDIPDKGETLKINKEIYIEELDERILLKSIKATDEGFEINFDSGVYKKENTSIIILGQDRSSWAIGSSDEEQSITMGIYNEDLTLIEKVGGKIKLRINTVSLSKDGKWNFQLD